MVLLGDPGVGKTSLASLFAGKQERDLHEQLGGRSPVWDEPGCGHRTEKPVTRGTGEVCRSHIVQFIGAVTHAKK